MPNSLRARLKNLVHKGVLTQKDLDRIVIMPVDGTGDLISRAEAIRIASGYCHWSNIPDELAKLPSVNPKPCDDAISRQAAIDLAYDMSEIDGEHFTEPCMVVDVEDIQELPPVTPTPKIGRWIPKSQYCAECSACGCVHSTNGADLTGKALVHKALFKYCPNCGCRMMVEPRESEE